MRGSSLAVSAGRTTPQGAVRTTHLERPRRTQVATVFVDLDRALAPATDTVDAGLAPAPSPAVVTQDRGRAATDAHGGVAILAHPRTSTGREAHDRHRDVAPHEHDHRRERRPTPARRRLPLEVGNDQLGRSSQSPLSGSRAGRYSSSWSIAGVGSAGSADANPKYRWLPFNNPRRRRPRRYTLRRRSPAGPPPEVDDLHAPATFPGEVVGHDRVWSRMSMSLACTV